MKDVISGGMTRGESMALAKAVAARLRQRGWLCKIKQAQTSVSCYVEATHEGRELTVRVSDHPQHVSSGDDRLLTVSDLVSLEQAIAVIEEDFESSKPCLLLADIEDPEKRKSELLDLRVSFSDQRIEVLKKISKTSPEVVRRAVDQIYKTNGLSSKEKRERVRQARYRIESQRKEAVTELRRVERELGKIRASLHATAIDIDARRKSELPKEARFDLLVEAISQIQSDISLIKEKLGIEAEQTD